MVNPLRRAPQAGLLFILLLFGLRPGWSQSLALASTMRQKPVETPRGTVRQLKDVLNDLKNTYGVDIMFELRAVEGFTVTAEAINPKATLEKNLGNVLRPLGLRYKKVNSSSYLVIGDKKARKVADAETRLPDPALSLPTPANGSTERGTATAELPLATPTKAPVADRVLTGSVKSETGERLPGVSVVVKKTTRGTTTDGNGEFRLNVPEDAATSALVLVFSFVGYLNQEVAIGNRNTIDVQLAPDQKTLNEVVVVGYGTQKKKDLTGSIVNLSGKDLLPVPAASFDQMMQGKVAGAQITQTTGAPGGNVNVVIRGISSITGGNQPLYVIDGYAIGSMGGGSDLSSFTGNSYSASGMATNASTTKINPLSTINPSDIESVEILKDASATAIYGSRGANGVVIITTKRGKQGKTSINLESSVGIQTLAKKLDMLNPQQFAQMVADGRDNAWVYLGGKASDPNSVRGQPQWVRPDYRNPQLLPTEGTDWQDVIFRPATVQNYQLSASGGTNDINYYVSGGYFDQEGIIIGSNLKKFTLRTNIDAQLTKRLKLGASFAGSYSYGNFARAEGTVGQRGLLAATLSSSPLAPIYDKNGNPYSELVDPMGVPVENPLVIVREFSDKRNAANIFTNNYLEYELMNGLRLKSSVGVNYTTNNNRIWKSSRIGDGFNLTGPPTAGAYVSKSLNWLNENTLSFQRMLGEKHNFNSVIGFTVQKNSDDILQAGASDFPTDYIPFLSGGNVNAGNNFISEWSMLSMLARVNYTFNGRYLLTATVRRDGSSRFGANHKWGTFPSFSLGYRLSDEPFMAGLTFVNDLKIRASYGTSGNNLIGNYAHIGLLGTSRYVTTSGIVLGITPQSLANDDLTWEKSLQADIGLDISLFKNRLSFTVDAYRNVKKGLLLNTLLPAASGFDSSIQNIGEVENKGLELTVSSENVRGKDFSWTTNLNLSTNRNKVLALSTSSSRIVNSPYQVSQVGSPISSFFMLNALGVFRTPEEIKASPLVHPATQPGDLRFEDVNKDGRITDADKKIVGNPWPKYTWGFNNKFTFRSISLSVSVIGTEGNLVYFQAGETQLNVAGVQNQLAIADNRWKSAEDPGEGLLPRAIRNDYARGNSMSSRYLFDGSYVRIRNINLSYSFPTALAGRLGLQNFTLFADVTNAYTFTKYPSFDPEASIGGDNIAKSGIDFYSYPVPRIATLGLRVAFK
ncbi:SusC/RagA family TonB-linked outer membrane protein [Larkinella punicea]|nr:TonB-dependent receptor [Larkinella punicea]